MSSSVTDAEQTSSSQANPPSSKKIDVAERTTAKAKHATTSQVTRKVPDASNASPRGTQMNRIVSPKSPLAKAISLANTMQNDTSLKKGSGWSSPRGNKASREPSPRGDKGSRQSSPRVDKGSRQLTGDLSPRNITSIATPPTPTESGKNGGESKKAHVRICFNHICKLRGSESLLMDLEDLAKKGAKVSSRECMGHCGMGPNVELLLPAETPREVIGVTSFEKIVELLGDALSSSSTGLVISIPDGKYKVAKLKYDFRRSTDQSSKVLLLSEAFRELGGESCLKDVGGLAELLVLRSQLLLQSYAGSALVDARRVVQLMPKWHRGYAMLAEALGACFGSSEGLTALNIAETYGHEKGHIKQLRSQLSKSAARESKSLEQTQLQREEAEKTVADWNMLVTEAHRSIESSHASKKETPRKVAKKTKSKSHGRANNYAVLSNMPADEPTRRVDIVDIEDVANKMSIGAVSFCRCYKSQAFPYCDGAHNLHNDCVGDNAGPVVLKAFLETMPVAELCSRSDEEKTRYAKGPRANNYGVVSNMPPDSPSKRVDMLDLREIRATLKSVGVASLCRCYKSSKFPFCDGSHNQHNLHTGDNAGPLVLKVFEEAIREENENGVEEEEMVPSQSTRSNTSSRKDTMLSNASSRKNVSIRSNIAEEELLGNARGETTASHAFPNLTSAPSYLTWFQKSLQFCCRSDDDDQDTDGEVAASSVFDDTVRQVSVFSFGNSRRAEHDVK